jgi:hypothetical protein
LLTVISSIAKSQETDHCHCCRPWQIQQNLSFEVTQKESGRVAWMNDDEIAAQPDEWVKGEAIPEARGGNLLVLNAKRAMNLALQNLPVTTWSSCERDWVSAKPQISVLLRRRG